MIYTIAGTGYEGRVGDNGPALCAGTPNVRGVCLDHQGNLYLTCSNSVRKVDLATGIITNVAGSDMYSHTGDGGPAVLATLKDPYDVCIDQNNNLYISEYSGFSIRKINLNTGIISTIGGTGVQGYSGDGGQATLAMIDNPQGMYCDPSGNLIFADFRNSRIRKIDMATGVITTIAGNGSAVHSGNNGLAINAGTPYPIDIAIDKAGNIFFLEVYGNFTSRLRRIDAGSGVITTIAGSSGYLGSGDGGPASAADLFDPTGLFVDDAGNLFITEYDVSRVRKIDGSTGIITTIAGNGTNSYSGDGGHPLTAGLHYPMGLAVDKNGDLFVADYFNHRVREISAFMTVTPILPATIVIASSPAIPCPGTPVIFSTEITNVPVNSTYQWLVNDVEISTNPEVFVSSTLKGGDRIVCVLTTSTCSKTPIRSNELVIQQGNAGTAPTISIAVNDTNICAGDNVSFTARVENAGIDPQFDWKVNGISTGYNSQGFPSSGFNNGDKVSCSVTSIPGNGCGLPLTIESRTVTILVKPSVISTLSVRGSVSEACEGAPVIFTATTQNEGQGAIFNWTINGVAVGGNSKEFTTTRLVSTDEVRLQVIPGSDVCPATPLLSTPLTTIIHPLPLVSVQPADTVVALQQQLQLKADVSGNPAHFEWRPASSLTSSASLMPVTIPMLKTTTFILDVWSDQGCRSSASSKVRVYAPLYMPGVFTPNNDGLNDVFQLPPGSDISLSEFSVYNRWGVKVFSTTDASRGWDGFYKGVLQDTGLFTFIIRGTDSKGKIVLKGTIMLLR